MKKKLLYYSLVYLAIILAFAIYFASNLTVYVRYKGDEFIYSLYFLLLITYIFYLILYFTVFDKSLLLFILLLLSPLLISVVAFFVGFIIMMLFFQGTPAETIYIYCFTYGYISVGAIVFWLYLKGDL